MKTPSILPLVKGAFIALLAFTLGSTAAQAQAIRTWVSGVGDDVNPCSRTAPCKTFAGAISKTFINGEINALDPGGFGTVTITKSMTIDGSGGPHASILASLANGVTINIAPGNVNDPQRTVTLRNLSINGAGSSGAVGTRTGINGVNITTNGADEVNIENCVIFNFSQLGVRIAPNSACRVNIKNCIIRDCDTGAVHAASIVGGAVVSISKSSLNASKFGFRADDNVKAVLDDCVLSGNANNGAFTNNSGGNATKLMVSRCTINDTGGFGILSSGGTSTVFISNNAVFNNVTGVGTAAGGVMTSLGNNNINGNTTDGAPKP